MILRICCYLLLCCFCLQALAQKPVSGIVLDADTKQPLPFATLRQQDSKQGFIADINGRFAFNLLSGVNSITISYTGYQTKTVSTTNTDTIFLQPAYNASQEVIVRPPYDKIKRIINSAISNKQYNNPDKYEQYRYDIYYKMLADAVPNEEALKARRAKEDKKAKRSEEAQRSIDSIRAATKKENDSFFNNNHVLFSETYSRIAYERPGKRQETVLASRFSGFKKTFFTNVVTGVLPFHAYDDFIKLNTVDYINPLSQGWQSRYQFDLIDELQDGTDTIFIFKYKAKKGVVFKSLQGMLYITPTAMPYRTSPHKHLIQATGVY